MKYKHYITSKGIQLDNVCNYWVCQLIVLQLDQTKELHYQGDLCVNVIGTHQFGTAEFERYKLFSICISPDPYFLRRGGQHQTSKHYGTTIPPHKQIKYLPSLQDEIQSSKHPW